MIYKKVRRIEEQISAIGMGCWNFGGDWDGYDEKKTIKIVHAAIDYGINLFDIAPVYGFGESERILGKALKGGRRQKVIIASKCGLSWYENKETYNDLSKKRILREIDESLMRLGTDYIDIYQLHWPDKNTDLEETISALEEIKKAGKIRYIGLSNFSKADIEKIMSMTEISVLQGLYNMFERNAKSYHNIPLDYRTEREILPLVKEHGLAFLPYSPLFQGLLAGRFLDGRKFSKEDIRNANPKLVSEDFEIYLEGAKRLDEFSKEIGRPMNEIALNWLRQKDEVSSIIAGASSVEQLEENLNSLTWDLSEEELKNIDKIIEPFEDM